MASSIDGVINNPGDVDWIKVSLTAGQPVVFSLAPDSALLTSVLDLQVLDSTGNMVDPMAFTPSAVAMEYGANPAQTSITATTTGTYYLRVASAGQATGSYTLSAATGVADDYASNTATTGVVSVGGKTSGTISNPGDVDWIKVSLTAGQTVVFSLAPDSALLTSVLDLQVLDSTGNMVDPMAFTPSAVAMEYGANPAQTSITATTTGTYYLRVASAGQATGSYTLSAATGAADDYASNTATTGVVSVGGKTSGTISNPGDVDWIKVSLTAGQTVVFSLAPDSALLTSVLDLQVLDSTGNMVDPMAFTPSALAMEYGANPAQTSITATTTGTYYLRVASIGQATGSYTLSAATGAADDYASNTATTGVISVGGKTSGTINNPGDVDWIKVSLTAGQTVVFSLAPDSALLTSGLDLQVLDSTGNMVDPMAFTPSALATAYGANPAQTSITATTTGTYYLRVASIGQATGSYTLSAATGAADDYASNTATTGVISVGGKTSGTISNPGDVDWIKVSLTAGQTVVFSLAPDSALLTSVLDLQVLDSAGKMVDPMAFTPSALATAYGANPAQTSITATTTGTYYVRVASIGQATGSYTLSVATGAADDYASNTGTTGIISVGNSTPDWFDANYYLASKAALLNAQKSGGRTNWTATEVLQAITSSGLTVYAHYVQYGQADGLNPNAWFDQACYLQEKAAALNAAAYAGRTNWTPAQVLQAITGSGLTVYAHYVQYGQADGLNPNAWFDQAHYLQEKAAVLNATAYAGRTNWTPAQVLQAITGSGLTVYAHYVQYGQADGLNPNAWFNQAYYLQEKAAVLNAAAYAGRTDWTPAQVLQAITGSGLTVYAHYVQYGQADGLNPNVWFNQACYLQEKAAALNAAAYAGRTNWTSAEVLQAITGSGLTVYAHYVQYGQADGLNPNAYFDQAYYLQQKAAVLNAAAYSGRTNWTSAQVFQAIVATGLTVFQHFAQYGVNDGLNPSASFNVQIYLQNKARALDAQDYGGRTNWTTAEVLSAIESSGLDPISHYLLFGKADGISPITLNAKQASASIQASFAASDLEGSSYSAATTTLSASLGGAASDGLILAGSSNTPVTVTLSDTGTVTLTPTDAVTAEGTLTGLSSLSAADVTGCGVVLEGNSSANTLIGSAGDDTICGGRGADSIFSGGGSNTLVYHFGDTVNGSDSQLFQQDNTSLRPGDNVDFTLGNEKFTFCTSSGELEMPTTIYYGGTVSVTDDVDKGIYTVTAQDNSVTTYTSQNVDDFINAVYTAGIADKNGVLKGGALGANEATVVNLCWTTVASGVSTTTTSGYMAVNDANVAFDNKDVLIQLSSAYTGSYDATTGIINKSLLLATS